MTKFGLLNRFIAVKGVRACRYSPLQRWAIRCKSTDIIFSGIQPTSRPHIGNYLGVIKKWIDLQDSPAQILYSIVDLHALSSVGNDSTSISHTVKEMVVCLLACGVDPARCILFQQSQIPQHGELMWILSCLTPIGWLNRMTQWKVKSDNLDSQSIYTGLLTYPILMAADILLYNATHVPVGDDQLQHMELTRDIVRTFNDRYHTQYFIEPQLIIGDVPRVMSLRFPDKKMSKSDTSTYSRIELTDSPELIQRKLKKAVTDSISKITYDPENRPGVSNLVTLYAAFSECTVEDTCRQFQFADTGQFKQNLADLIIAKLKPIRNEALKLQNERHYVDTVLKEGIAKAQELANKNIQLIKNIVLNHHE